jgi:hypothetical protein
MRSVLRICYSITASLASASLSKADMDRTLSRVCLVPEADIRGMLACYPLRRHDCSWALREVT